MNTIPAIAVPVIHIGSEILNNYTIFENPQFLPSTLQKPTIMYLLNAPHSNCINIQAIHYLRSLAGVRSKESVGVVENETFSETTK